MKTFEITINGNTETVHAKHIARGNFLVRKLKTCNEAQVKYIETLFNNNGNHSYRIKSFYETSPFFNQNPEQKVIMLETELEN